MLNLYFLFIFCYNIYRKIKKELTYMEKLFYINEKSENNAFTQKREIKLMLEEGWTIKSITPFAQHVASPNSPRDGAYGAYIVLEN